MSGLSDWVYVRKLPVIVVVLFAGMLVIALAIGLIARHESARAMSGVSIEPSRATERVDPTRLIRALRTGAAVRLVGIGSSVGAGAELTDSESQSPVGHLGQALRDAFDSPNLTVKNLSVDGSTAFDGLQVYKSQVHRLHPTVLLIAFGMNDGQTAQFNSGETFPGGITALRETIRRGRADGALVLVATTPSPHTVGNDFSLPAGLPVIYPTPDAAVVPSAGRSIAMVDGQPFSARHATWNAAARTAAHEEGAVLIDAAALWPAAVRTHGEDRLFNVQHGPADPGRFVHPNLLGHQLSYWPAEDAWVEKIASTASLKSGATSPSIAVSSQASPTSTSRR